MPSRYAGHKDPRSESFRGQEGSQGSASLDPSMYSSQEFDDREVGERDSHQRQRERASVRRPSRKPSRRHSSRAFLDRHVDDEEEEEEDRFYVDDEATEEVDIPSPSSHLRRSPVRRDDRGRSPYNEYRSYSSGDAIMREEERRSSRQRSTSAKRRRNRDDQVMPSPRASSKAQRGSSSQAGGTHQSRRHRPPTDMEPEEREDAEANSHHAPQCMPAERRIRGAEDFWPGEELPAYIYSPTSFEPSPPAEDVYDGASVVTAHERGLVSAGQRWRKSSLPASRRPSREKANRGSRVPTDGVDLDDVEVDVRDAGRQRRHSERLEAYFNEDLSRRQREQQQRRRLDRIRAQQEQYQQQQRPFDAERGQPPAGLTLMADPFAFTESVLLNYENADRPWDSGCCAAACSDQPGVCLLSSCCCLTAPFFLIQERRTLLLHTIRSRYVCCLGVVPCCWPPAALRPELYLAYVAPTTTEEARDHAIKEERRFRDGITDPNTPYRPSRKNKYPPVDANGDPVMPPVMSVDGVSAVGSVLNIVNGLPQYGGYNSVAQSRYDNGTSYRGPNQAPPPDSCSCCCGCCRFSAETNTCTLDYQQGCCLYWRHPTAWCLTGGCPLCCLVTEACCCMPCAALGNRTLIRRHYGFGPDRALDDSVACMYSCCVTCLSGKNLERRRQAYAQGALSNERASCWLTFVRSVAACTAAACCLWPCMCCSIAQQRDAMERRGYPQLSAFHPSDITGMV